MKIDLRLANPLLRRDEALFSRCARLCCEAAILSNRALIHRAKEIGKPIPLLYQSGVVYENEPPDMVDECVDIPTILERGSGDCMHLCCWRVAELREMGEKRARIALTWKVKGKNKRIFHVIVRRGNGSLEDPSKLLGM